MFVYKSIPAAVMLLVFSANQAYANDSDHFSHPMPYDDGWSGFSSGSHLQLNAISGFGARDWTDAKKSDLAIETYNGAGQLGVTGKGVSKPDYHQWALVGMLNWKSGYIGPFGVNASLYGGYKLDYSGPQTGYWLLQKNNGNMADQFGRIGRLNVRMALGDKQHNLLAQAGYVGVDPDYLNSVLFAKQPFPYGLTYLTMRGLTLQSKLNNLQLYGAYFDRIAQTASDGMGDLKDDKGKAINYIALLGAKYQIALPKNQQLILQGESSSSANYTKEYYGGLTYVIPFSKTKNVAFKANYFNTSKNGNGFDNPTMSKDGNLLNLNLITHLDKVSLYGAYSKTHAKNTSATGIVSNRFYYSPANNYTPQPGFLTDRLISDFAYDGEDTYLLGVGYNFSEFIPGLSAKVGYTWGNNISPRVGISKESETDLRIDYDIPGIKGLSTTIVNGYYTSTGKVTSHVPTKGFGQTVNDFRWFLNYKVNFI